MRSFFRLRSRMASVKKRVVPADILLALPRASGDIALNSSLTAYLKSLYPRARITLLTCPPNIPIAAMNPHLDRIVPLPENRVFTYRELRSLSASFAYDWFVIPTFDPDLVRLIFKTDWLHMQYYLAGLVVAHPPVPRLQPTRELLSSASSFLRRQKLRPQGYLYCNFSAITSTRYGLLPDNRDILLVLRLLSRAKIRTVFNVYGSRLRIILPFIYPATGTYLQNISLALQSRGVISVRTGLNDILASLPKSPPQLVIYPSNGGRDTSKYWSVCNLPLLFPGLKVKEKFYKSDDLIPQIKSYLHTYV